MQAPRSSFVLSAVSVAGALALVNWFVTPADRAAISVPTVTRTASPSASPTAATPSRSATVTASPSRSATSTPSATPSPTPSVEPTLNPTTSESAPATLPAGEGMVLYLTFDDGPDPKWTPAVLDLLASNGAHGTFFMIGQSAQDHPDLVARVRAEGHAVGDHTWSHPYLTKLSAADAQSQVARTSTLLGGTACTRPPYGATNASVNAMLASQGQRLQLWDIDTRDWSRPGAAAIVSAVNTGAKDGAVVLMHDGGSDRSQTVEALKQLLPALRAAGWRLEAIPGC